MKIHAFTSILVKKIQEKKGPNQNALIFLFGRVRSSYLESDQLYAETFESDDLHALFLENLNWKSQRLLNNLSMVLRIVVNIITIITEKSPPCIEKGIQVTIKGHSDFQKKSVRKSSDSNV